MARWIIASLYEVTTCEITMKAERTYTMRIMREAEEDHFSNVRFTFEIWAKNTQTEAQDGESCIVKLPDAFCFIIGDIPLLVCHGWWIVTSLELTWTKVARTPPLPNPPYVTVTMCAGEGGYLPPPSQHASILAPWQPDSWGASQTAYMDWDVCVGEGGWGKGNFPGRYILGRVTQRAV